jgi:hypothetical protein
MSARVWSSTPLWQIIDNGVMRPAKAKSYVLDQSHRPLPPSGWQSLHFGKLDKPVTMREVLADYAQFDSKKDYSLSYGPGTGTQLAKAQISQYNSVAWNEQIMNPGSGNLNIFSGRPMEIFNSEETAGLSGDVTTVIVTIKAMVAKIQSLKLNENDTTKLINDVYDKYLQPLITKFPSLKDPDTGVDIKDISYLLTLAPPASNANPNVVPVQLSKTTFTGSPPPVPAFPSGAATTTLPATHMDSANPPPLPAWPLPPQVPVFPDHLVEAPKVPDYPEYLKTSTPVGYGSMIPPPNIIRGIPGGPSSASSRGTASNVTPAQSRASDQTQFPTRDYSELPTPLTSVRPPPLPKNPPVIKKPQIIKSLNFLEDAMKERRSQIEPETPPTPDIRRAQLAEKLGITNANLAAATAKNDLGDEHKLARRAKKKYANTSKELSLDKPEYSEIKDKNEPRRKLLATALDLGIDVKAKDNSTVIQNKIQKYYDELAVKKEQARKEKEEDERKTRTPYKRKK